MSRCGNSQYTIEAIKSGIYMYFRDCEIEKYPIKFWKLPLHAIGCQCDVFPIDGEYFISFQSNSN